MKKRIIGVVIIMSVISFLFGKCSFFKEVRFCDLEIGKNFYGNRDGHYKKLPNNYCLDVELKSTTRLFKIEDAFLDKVFDPYTQYDDIIMQAHYIKGYYNDSFLILCEERVDDSCIYWSFEFNTNNIESYESEDDVYELFGFNSEQWFSLCNTNAEILD